MEDGMKNHVAIVLRDKNRILFVQRSAIKKSLPNIWAFPSGTVEEGEDENMTATREAKEELGIDIKVDKKLCEVELPELGVKLNFILCHSDFIKDITYDLKEIQNMRWLTFQEFFDEYNDKQIGHGLIYLRKHPEIWEAV